MSEKQITRAVPAADLSDLLANPSHAGLAFVAAEGVDAAPVTFLYRDGNYLVKPPAGATAGSEVALLVDEGLYHTELRGVLVRGLIGEPDTEGWAPISPSRVNAWNYGAMRRRAG